MSNIYRRGKYFWAIETTNKLSVNDGNDKNEDDPIPIFTDDDSKLPTFLTSLVGVYIIHIVKMRKICSN